MDFFTGVSSGFYWLVFFKLIFLFLFNVKEVFIYRWTYCRFLLEIYIRHIHSFIGLTDVFLKMHLFSVFCGFFFSGKKKILIFFSLMNFRGFFFLNDLERILSFFGIFFFPGKKNRPFFRPWSWSWYIGWYGKKKSCTPWLL